MENCTLYRVFVFALSLFLHITIISSQIEDQLGSCDPLVPQNCLLPFPNNFWTWKNESKRTGLSLRFTQQSFPVDRRGKGIDPSQWNELDGFSPTPAIMSYFPDLSLQNIPSHRDISMSLRDDSPTILLDCETLQLIPHWGELDQSTPDTSERALMLWPSRRLVSGRRYIVAMRGLVSTSTGLLIEASAAFASLRDGTPSTDPSVDLRRSHFETQIFALLQQINVNIDDLQLSWDFTVGSKESITDRLITMRNDATSRLPHSGPVYYITKVIDSPKQNIYRQIKGELEVPLYTDQKGPGSHLVLDQHGLPVFQSWVNTSFTLNIPSSFSSSSNDGMTVIYGHGLFGTQDEVNNNVLVNEANQNKYITVATDWWGLCAFDIAAVTKMITENLTDCSIIPDRSQQGILNFVILSKMMKSEKFANNAALMIDGKSVIDVNAIAFNGNSLGGINGITLMAISQDMIEGVMSVPGAPFALSLPRSADFTPYFDILKTRFTNPIDRINLLNIMQLLWDRSDPSGYMSYVTSNTFLDTPKKQIILQYALGDAQVSWLSALTLGRSIDAYMFPDNVREDNELLFGFEVSDSAVTTAVIQGFNYGAPSVPQTNIPPQNGNNTHSCPRQDDRAQNSMYTLFTSAVIDDYCLGACNPPNPPIDDPDCDFYSY